MQVHSQTPEHNHRWHNEQFQSQQHAEEYGLHHTTLTKPSSKSCYKHIYVQPQWAHQDITKSNPQRFIIQL